VTDDGLLGREGIESLLAELGRRCAAKGFEANLFLVGGGAMALAYSRERVTRDLDAVFEPKAKVYAEARLMADERGLPHDWLNDGVKGLLPDRADDDSRVGYSSDGLTVVVASPEYMFAMKALSARQTNDTEDLLALAKILDVHTPEQAFAIVEKFYGKQRLTINSQYFIEQTFSADQNDIDGDLEASTVLSAPEPRTPRAGKGSNQYQTKPRRSG
jgi:hypothetical protein